MELKDLKILAGSYRRIFNGGRASAADRERVMNDLKKRCFVKETTFSESHGRMGFNEGRRSIYAHINNMLTMNLENQPELPREYQK